MSDQLNVSKGLKIDSTCRASNVYKRRGVYRKKYLNEIWALIDGTDYLVSFLDTSESREYINKTSRGHLINSLPVLNLTEKELDDLKKRGPHKPILRYKYHPSSSVNQSGTLYERYEMRRLAGLNVRSGNLESEIDGIAINKKNRYSLPRIYKFPRGKTGDNNTNENDDEEEYGKIVDDILDLCEEEEEENDDNNENSGNTNDDNNENKNSGNANDDNNDNEISGDINDDNNENEKPENTNNESENLHNANDINENSENSNNENENSRNANDENNKENDNNQREDINDGIIKDRDIHLNLPNDLGIDAFGLQQEALREDELSSDDGDERKSNCGSGNDGAAEVVLQISLKHFIPIVNQDYKGEFTINTIPRSEWETIKAKGFDWVLFEDLPPTTNYEKLAATLRNCRLKSMMDYQSDEALKYFDGVRVRDDDIASYRCRFPDKTIVSVQSYQYSWNKSESSDESQTKNSNDQNPLNYATYVYDNRPIECLKARDAKAFARLVQKETKEDDRRHLLHYMCTQNLDFNTRSSQTAAAMLLTLPGMRVIDFTEIQLVDLVLIVLCKKAVRRGVFSFVDYKSTGNTFAWKYTKGKQHILIVANFDTRQTTTTIICDDCPKPIESDKGKKDNGKVAFVDILSQTTYLRDPEEMRTKGLNVILYEYEAQIFEY